MPDTYSTHEKHFYSTELSAHMEDYIETISLLAQQNKVVRVKDIAAELDIKMPSVTAALNKLKEQGLILYEKYGYIELTRKGKTVAQKVYDKHRLIATFLNTILFIDSSQASEEACRLEHHISPETCTQLLKIMDFFQDESAKGEKWHARFQNIMQQRILINYAPGDRLVIDHLTHQTKRPHYLQKGALITIVSTDNESSTMEIRHNGEQYTIPFSEASAVYAKPLTNSW